MGMVDFLPICDLLFNLISMACYFCDIVFATVVLSELCSIQKPNISESGPGTNGSLKSSSGLEYSFNIKYVFVSNTWYGLYTVVFVSSIIFCQIVSLCLTRQNEKQRHLDAIASDKSCEMMSNRKEKKNKSTITTIIIHMGGCSIFWRYAKLLLMPIDIETVKREMSELSVLRMIHSFVYSVPSMLLQGYLIANHRMQLEAKTSSSYQQSSNPFVRQSELEDFRSSFNWNSEYSSAIDVKLITIASSFSLFNTCWALASFNKHIKREHLEKLVLTWIGVILQFLWRLGTVGARQLALILYTAVNPGWTTGLFLTLHWICMLISQVFQSHVIDQSNDVEQETRRATSQNVETVREMTHENKLKHNPNKSQTSCKKLISFAESSLTSLVLTTDFFNTRSSPTRRRIIVYYTLILAENNMLMFLWSSNLFTSLTLSGEERVNMFSIVNLLFFAGLAMMTLYYTAFHRTKLEISSSSSLTPITALSNDTEGTITAHISSQAVDYDNNNLRYDEMNTIPSNSGSHREGRNGMPISNSNTEFPHQKHFTNEQSYCQVTRNHRSQETRLPPLKPSNSAVFNCALNQALMNKKRKIPRHIPPLPHNLVGLAKSSTNEYSTNQEEFKVEENMLNGAGEYSIQQLTNNGDDVTCMADNTSSSYGESFVFTSSTRSSIGSRDSSSFQSPDQSPNSAISSQSHHKRRGKSNIYQQFDDGNPQFTERWNGNGRQERNGQVYDRNNTDYNTVIRDGETKLTAL